MMPSILLGVFTMWRSNISYTIWLVNFILLFIVSIYSYFILSHKKNLKTNNSITILISVILLLLTFIDNGISNVHRWLLI